MKKDRMPTHRYRFAMFPPDEAFDPFEDDHELYWRALGTWVDEQPKSEATAVGERT